MRPIGTEFISELLMSQEDDEITVYSFMLLVKDRLIV